MRLLAIVFFPVILAGVVVAMLVAPLIGAHFCPQEALPILWGAGAGTAGMPFLARLLRRRAKPHCCEPDHKHEPESVCSRCGEPDREGGHPECAEAARNESYDPHSDDYVGHTRAFSDGKARCICESPARVDLYCPFHGR